MLVRNLHKTQKEPGPKQICPKKTPEMEIPNPKQLQPPPLTTTTAAATATAAP